MSLSEGYFFDLPVLMIKWGIIVRLKTKCFTLKWLRFSITIKYPRFHVQLACFISCLSLIVLKTINRISDTSNNIIPTYPYLWFNMKNKVLKRALHPLNLPLYFTKIFPKFSILLLNWNRYYEYKFVTSITFNVMYQKC